MSLLTDSRLEITAALAACGVKVYDFVPAVPIPPCIVVMPSETWITPGRIGGRTNMRVDWKVSVLVAPKKNQPGTVDLEDLAQSVLEQLPGGYRLVRAGAPQIVELGPQGSAYTVDITITVELKEG